MTRAHSTINTQDLLCVRHSGDWTQAMLSCGRHDFLSREVQNLNVRIDVETNHFRSVEKGRL